VENNVTKDLNFHILIKESLKEKKLSTKILLSTKETLLSIKCNW